MPFDFAGTPKPTPGDTGWGATLNSLLDALMSAANSNASHNHSGVYSPVAHSHDFSGSYLPASSEANDIPLQRGVLGAENVQAALEALVSQVSGGLIQTGIHFTASATTHTITEANIVEATGFDPTKYPLLGINYHMNVSIYEEEKSATPPYVGSSSVNFKIFKNDEGDVVHLDEIYFSGLTNGTDYTLVLSMRYISTGAYAFNIIEDIT